MNIFDGEHSALKKKNLKKSKVTLLQLIDTLAIHCFYNRKKQILLLLHIYRAIFFTFLETDE